MYIVDGNRPGMAAQRCDANSTSYKKIGTCPMECSRRVPLPPNRFRVPTIELHKFPFDVRVELRRSERRCQHEVRFKGLRNSVCIRVVCSFKSPTITHATIFALESKGIIITSSWQQQLLDFSLVPQCMTR
jgi:hypothetical protein